MTDWKKLALALDPPIPPEDVEKMLPVIETLYEAFAPLQQSIPPGADLWSGPVEEDA